MKPMTTTEVAVSFTISIALYAGAKVMKTKQGIHCGTFTHGFYYPPHIALV